MDADDFVPDKAGISKEFKDLKSIDQQKHVLRFDQAVAKMHGKRNRYVFNGPNSPIELIGYIFIPNKSCIVFQAIIFSPYKGILIFSHTTSIGSN